MKRALILIIALSALTFGGGFWLDNRQQSTAMQYLNGLYGVRQLIQNGEMMDALSEQAYLHALWQHDAHWLNALADHHHTRDVESFMRHLATALQEQNRAQALWAMDDLIDAFEEISQRNMAAWENIM